MDVINQNDEVVMKVEDWKAIVKTRPA